MAFQDLFIAATSECHRFLRRNVETLSALLSFSYIVGKEESRNHQGSNVKE